MNQNSSNNFIKNMAIFTFAFLLGIASTHCYNKYYKNTSTNSLTKTTNTTTEAKSTNNTKVYDIESECLNKDICTKTYNLNINNQEYKISYKKDINEFNDELIINNNKIDVQLLNKIAFLDNGMIAIISSYPNLSKIE